MDVIMDNIGYLISFMILLGGGVTHWVNTNSKLSTVANQVKGLQKDRKEDNERYKDAMEELKQDHKENLAKIEANQKEHQDKVSEAQREMFIKLDLINSSLNDIKTTVEVLKNKIK